MGIFSALKDAVMGATREINKEYSKSQDFLNAVTASSALIIFADGTAEDSEKKKAMEVLTGHGQLSSLYNRQVIETSLYAALAHGTTASGRQELARQLDKVTTLPNGAQMSEDVYLVAFDIASSNSRNAIGEDEQRVLNLLAKHLNVDPKKFEF